MDPNRGLTKSRFVIAAGCLVVSLVAAARAADKTPLTGHWDFNLAQSDDASQKVQEAQQNDKARASNTDGTYPGGTNPGSGGTYPGGVGGTYPGGGGYPGGIGRGGIGGMGGGMGRPRQGPGMSNRGDAISSDEWDRLSANPKYLSIDQRSDQIVVTDESDHAQTFYLDGKKHDEKDADGRKVSTKASWEGAALVTETRLPHSERLTETFRASEDGKQLYVVTRFEAPSLAGPLSIRRVYDEAKNRR